MVSFGAETTSPGYTTVISSLSGRTSLEKHKAVSPGRRWRPQPAVLTDRLPAPALHRVRAEGGLRLRPARRRGCPGPGQHLAVFLTFEKETGTCVGLACCGLERGGEPSAPRV